LFFPLTTAPRLAGSTLFPYTTLFRSREPAARFRIAARVCNWRAEIAAQLAHVEVAAVGLLADVPDLGTVRHATDNRECRPGCGEDRKSTRLNSSHVAISYAVFCLKKK